MTRPIACLVLLLASSAPIFALDPPDSEINPQTGLIETVVTVWNGSDHDVRLAVDRGALPPLTAEVAAGSTDDFDPRTAIASSGKVSVVWTRDASTGQVRVRSRSGATWGADRLVSDSSENSKHAEIIEAASATRVIYEIHGGSSKSVAVSIIADEPDPIGTRMIVVTGISAEVVDARIHAEDGHVWVTWVHDSLQIGWSELKPDGTWASAGDQSYSGSDIDAARALVRETVLGL